MWQKRLLPKICHIYPTMMKLGTVILNLKKIQKIYESCDTPLEFLTLAVFHRKSANFDISRNTDIGKVIGIKMKLLVILFLLILRMISLKL